MKQNHRWINYLTEYSIWFNKKGQYKGTGRKPELKCGNREVVEKFIDGLRNNLLAKENGIKYLATWGKKGW